METIWPQFEFELQSVHTIRDVEAIKIRYLGKKGLVVDQMKRLKDLSDDEKPLFGKAINDLRQGIEKALETALTDIEERELSKKLETEKTDVTLPGRHSNVGAAHPVTQGI